MGVFDVHIHVQPWQMMKPSALALMDDEGHRGVKQLLESPQALLAHLDREGVERACCINYVSPDVMGFPRETNDWIANFTRGHHDRLIPVGSVHPRYEADPLAELRRVLDLGIRMIKIHPPHQLFAANAYIGDLPALAGLYEECERRSIPVMIHTGTSIFPGARNRFADPMAVDDVAIDFPELRIILAHAGRPLYGDTVFFLVRRHRNVYADLSGIPPRQLLRYVPRLSDMVSKALWGTDWPSPGITSLSDNIAAFRSLGLGGAVEEQILRTNAEAIFGGL
jgi:predicted TIM-barrel fold metal-dependent hydrolase